MSMSQCSESRGSVEWGVGTQSIYRVTSAIHPFCNVYRDKSYHFLSLQSLVTAHRVVRLHSVRFCTVPCTTSRTGAVLSREKEKDEPPAPPPPLPPTQLPLPLEDEMTTVSAIDWHVIKNKIHSTNATQQFSQLTPEHAHGPTKSPESKSNWFRSW